MTLFKHSKSLKTSKNNKTHSPALFEPIYEKSRYLDGFDKARETLRWERIRLLEDSFIEELEIAKEIANF